MSEARTRIELFCGCYTFDALPPRRWHRCLVHRSIGAGWLAEVRTFLRDWWRDV